jgi:hypothetical protein
MARILGRIHLPWGIQLSSLAEIPLNGLRRLLLSMKASPMQEPSADYRHHHNQTPQGQYHQHIPPADVLRILR